VRILIAGTGGVGGYYGARLAAAGEDVTFLARGAMLDALRSRGLEVRADLGDVRLEDVDATDHPDAAEGAFDAVLVTVKSYDTADVADAAAAAIGDGTAVCSLQNGVDNEDLLRTRFPAASVLGGTGQIEAFVLEPGVVAQRGSQSNIAIGAFSAEGRPAAERLGAALDAAGVPVTVVEDVVVELWRKLVVIAGLGITAFARAGIGAVLGDPQLRALFRSLLEETEAVARAKGVAVPDGIAGVVFAYAERTLEPAFVTSMARDVERGRPLEIESLNGAVVRHGRSAGVPTPANGRVTDALLPMHRAAMARRGGGRSVRDAAGESHPA
jgi:2-dehydropantoate 2-reductase